MDTTSALIIGISIAAAGYFIGNGLKYGLVFFKSQNLNEGKKDIDLGNILHEKLIKESNIHSWLGIPKNDAKELIKQYPDIPHVDINGNVYFKRDELNDWFDKLGKKD